MNKIFNLKSFRKNAFYKGARGYAQAETRAKQICYKCKYDDNKSAQEAWDECNKEYNEAADKGIWVIKYSNFPSNEERADAKTPAVQKMGKGKKK